MTIEYIIFISLVILVIAYTAYYFFFNIYEITIKVTPVIISDRKQKIKIKIKPINSLGNAIPLRRVYTEFNIIEGTNLIYTNHKNKKKGLLELRAKDAPGKVKIEIKSKYSLFPNIVEFNIV